MCDVLYGCLMLCILSVLLLVILLIYNLLFIVIENFCVNDVCVCWLVIYKENCINKSIFMFLILFN